MSVQKTTRTPGETFTFYNGGEVVVHWIRDGWVGYSALLPGSGEQRLGKMRSENFERAISLPHGVEEGQMV